MFREVSSTVNFPALEEEILKFWKEHRTFEKSVEQRAGAPRYVFYEGPPTANGLPGIHHVLARVFKDLFPRYKTMRGYYSVRKGGWDTHGLPVELEIEKELGFSGKKAIEDYGIAEFNARCKESVFRYVKEWEELTDRIGFWIDMKDPYITLTSEYMESVWWILKQFWERGLLYQDYKVVPYCPRCGTSLSDHEVALGYDETDDPSIYVRFRLRDDDFGPEASFLVWTTTPWTLPGNVALAVHPYVEYVLVEQQTDDGRTERLILARALLNAALVGDYRVVRSVTAGELVGRHYQPLYHFLPVPENQDYAYVVAADFVTTTDGTGIVHMAPAFGGEDLEVGKQYNLPILHTVDLNGAFINAVTPWKGLFVKDADPLIIEELQQRGLMYRVGTYRHTYPFCWRCDTPLLYYAKTSWYVQTTRYRDELVRLNKEHINWYPAHIRDGRFGDWLANNVDWALSRERYWGTPLPVWVCESCGEKECIGGVAELKERVTQSGRKVDGAVSGPDANTLDLHRPYIDQVVFTCHKCGGTMRRVPEVIDCWFDSGAMPVAQYHYPYGDRELWQSQFPADFICEAVDQTRGWFYSLHAISTLLFQQVCYRNCVCLGHIQDAQGQKMSKSRGNVVDPWTVINAHGADALRWYLYTATPVGNSYRFSAEPVGEVVRRFLLTLWNTYSFFVTYANIDKWTPPTPQEAKAGNKPASLYPFTTLDRWILSELHLLIHRVTTCLDNYDVTGAARSLTQFVEDLSNWYVRRNRRRFWKSEEDQDKAAAYLTLYECLVTLSKLLAPFIPFTSEAIYRNLVCSVDPSAPESVHLCDFPVADLSRVDEQLVADTRLAMRVVSLGHAARNQAGIKVRQPLSRALVVPRHPAEAEALERLADQIADELNVKQVSFLSDVRQVAEYQISTVPSLLGKKYGSRFPQIRAAVSALDGWAVAQAVTAGRVVEIEVGGEKLSLLPEELSVRVSPRPGFALAEEAGYLVAVDTTLTEELRQEGLAREIVRRIQTQRKEAGFRIEDHIQTYYQAGPTLASVFQTHATYIANETLSVALVAQEPPKTAFTVTHDIEGQELRLGLVRYER